jgi:hypothetical protein
MVGFCLAQVSGDLRERAWLWPAEIDAADGHDAEGMHM